MVSVAFVSFTFVSSLLVSARPVHEETHQLVKRQLSHESFGCGAREITATAYATLTVKSGSSCRLKCKGSCAGFFYDASTTTENCVLFRASRVGKSTLEVNGKTVCAWTDPEGETRGLPVLEECPASGELHGKLIGKPMYVTSSEACMRKCEESEVECTDALTRLSKDNDIVCRLFQADENSENVVTLFQDENACPIPEDVEDPETGIDFDGCDVGDLEGFYLGPAKILRKRAFCMNLCNDDINCSHMITVPIAGKGFECMLFSEGELPAELADENSGYTASELSKSCPRSKSHAQITNEIMENRQHSDGKQRCGQWDLAIQKLEGHASLEDIEGAPSSEKCLAACDGECEMSLFSNNVEPENACSFFTWRHYDDFELHRMEYRPNEVVCSTTVVGPSTKKTKNRACEQKKLIGYVYKTLSSLLVPIPDENACLELCKKETGKNCNHSIFHYAPPGYKANSCKFFKNTEPGQSDEPYWFRANEVACPSKV